MNFKKSYKKASGYTPICKVEECSLKKLEFGIIELEDGESISYDTGDKETGFIMLEGYCTVKFDGQIWEKVGNRNTVFENKKAVSFYMPIRQNVSRRKSTIFCLIPRKASACSACIRRTVLWMRHTA